MAKECSSESFIPTCLSVDTHLLSLSSSVQRGPRINGWLEGLEEVDNVITAEPGVDLGVWYESQSNSTSDREQSEDTGVSRNTALVCIQTVSYVKS